MGFLDDLFKEGEKLKKEKDMTEGFADGVMQEEYNEQHPIVGPIADVFSEPFDAMRGKDYTDAKKAGREYAKRKKKRFW